MCPEQDRCNRRPFQSGDGCHRGNVDVTQFDDFPYCKTIDPTDPQVPPEIVDAPMAVLLPTYSCSCIDIKYKFDFKYSRSRDFVASGSFSADGDCCEGNYGTTMNLQIPCPVLSGGDKTIKMSVGYGDGAGSFSGVLISADSSNCTISPNDVAIDLEIPCPVIGLVGPKKISAQIKYGSSGSSDEAEYIDVNPDDCKIEAVDAALALEIPCPVRTDGDKKIKIGISYGDDFTGASAEVVKTDHGKCTIEPRDADLNLSIPCPLPNINIKTEYEELGSSASGGMTVSSSYNKQECRKTFTIKTSIPRPNLNIPCPVQGGEDEVTMEVKYGSGSGFKGKLISVDPETCAVSTVSDTISLSIPCPVQIPLAGVLGSLNAHMKLGISYFGGSGNLGFESFSDDFILTNPTACTIQAKSIDAKLHIPCPVNYKGLKIETDVDGAASGASFYVDDNFDVTKCERRLKFKVSFPQMKGNANSSVWIGGDIRFASAPNSNVQVLTSDVDGVKTITIGVYYV